MLVTEAHLPLPVKTRSLSLSTYTTDSDSDHPSLVHDDHTKLDSLASKVAVTKDRMRQEAEEMLVTAEEVRKIQCCYVLLFLYAILCFCVIHWFCVLHYGTLWYSMFFFVYCSHLKVHNLYRNK